MHILNNSPLDRSADFRTVIKEPIPKINQKLPTFNELQEIIQAEKKSKSSLNQLAVRFSRWANNHTTLAKILCVVTLGFFWFVWNRGNAVDNINPILDLIQKMSDESKQKLKQPNKLIRPYKDLQIAPIKKPITEPLAYRIVAPGKKPSTVQPSAEFSNASLGELIRVDPHENKEPIIEVAAPQEESLDLDEELFLPKALLGIVLEYVQDTDRKIMKNWHIFRRALQSTESATIKLISSYQRQVLENLNPKLFAVEIQTIKGMKELLDDDNFNSLEIDVVTKERRIIRYIVALLKLDHHKPEDKYKNLLDIKFFALLAVKNRGFALGRLPDKYKEDKEIILAASKSHFCAFYRASDALKKDIEFQKEVINENSLCLAWADDKLKNNKEFVMGAVKKDGFSFGFASDELQKDEELGLEAVMQNGLALQNEFIYKIRAIALEAVKRNGLALEFASDILKNDREIVTEAIKQNPQAFKFASKALQDDAGIILEAVKGYGYAFLHASESKRKNRDFVLAAIKVNPKVFGCALNDVQRDKEFILEAVASDDYSTPMSWAHPFLHDRSFMMELVKRNGRVIYYGFNDDREIVLEAVNQDGRAYASASARLKNDKEICLAAIEQNYEAYFFAPKVLQNDKEVILAAAEKFEFIYAYYLKYDDHQDFLLEVLKLRGPEFLSGLPNNLKTKKDFILKAVKINGEALEFASYGLRNNKEVVLEAVKKSKNALEFATSKLRKDPDILAAMHNLR